MDKIALAKRQELLGILEAVCQELELTETQHKSAEEKYNSVGKWLNAGGIITIYDPDIFPQGSVILGTTVRPIGRIEFDVDLVCKLIRGSRELGQAYSDTADLTKDDAWHEYAANSAAAFTAGFLRSKPVSTLAECARMETSVEASKPPFTVIRAQSLRAIRDDEIFEAFSAEMKTRECEMVSLD